MSDNLSATSGASTIAVGRAAGVILGAAGNGIPAQITSAGSNTDTYKAVELRQDDMIGGARRRHRCIWFCVHSATLQGKIPVPLRARGTTAHVRSIADSHTRRTCRTQTTFLSSMLTPSCSCLRHTPVLQPLVFGCPKRLRTDQLNLKTTHCACHASRDESDTGTVKSLCCSMSAQATTCFKHTHLVSSSVQETPAASSVGDISTRTQLSSGTFTPAEQSFR